MYNKLYPLYLVNLFIYLHIYFLELNYLLVSHVCSFIFWPQPRKTPKTHCQGNIFFKEKEITVKQAFVFLIVQYNRPYLSEEFPLACLDKC